MQDNHSIPSDNAIPHKRCTKCERELPMVSFHNDKSGAGGRSARCKECTAKYTAMYRQKYKDEIKERKHRYYEANKEAIYRKQKVRNQINKEKVAEYQRKYRENHREKLDKRIREYHEVNAAQITKWRDKYRVENREKIKERDRAWWKAHPEKNREYRQNRRARKIGDGGKVSAAEWRDVLARFDGKCAKCGSNQNIHMDHVVPLSKGGHHSYDNIQPLCQTCNLRKNAKTEDYRGRMYTPAPLPFENTDD